MGAKESSEVDQSASSSAELSPNNTPPTLYHHPTHPYMQQQSRARYRTHSLGGQGGEGGGGPRVGSGHALVMAAVAEGSGSDRRLAEDRPRSRSLVGPTLPVRLLPLHAVHGIKCPVCSKVVQSEEAECHIVMCLTKPRVSYNEDVLTEGREEECVICLDSLDQGDTIARLPCLCIYHKSCIDQWFKVNRTCPEHPGD